MEAKKKFDYNRMGMFVLQLFLGLLLGFLVGRSVVARLPEHRFGLPHLMMGIAFLFVAVFVHINIHELGHLLAGNMLGYCLISFRIGLLAWNNENGKIRFSIMKNHGYGGLCAMIPPQKKIPLHGNMIFFSGGLVLNTVFSFFFLSVVNRFPDMPFWLALLLICLAGVGFFLVIINFLPMISQNLPTDGKIIWSFLLKKPFARKLTLVNDTTVQLAAGTRPADLHMALEPDFEDPQPYDMIMALFFYQRALDQKKWDKMADYLEKLEQSIDRFPAPSLPSLVYELCFFACIQKNHDQAILYYKKAGPILAKDRDANGYRIKAYYAYHIEEEPNTALSFCKQGLAVVEDYPIKGLAKMEKDLLQTLQKRIEKEAL